MIRQAYKFIRHWFTAQTRYDVHSPFVYQFVIKILPHRKSNWGKKVDALRNHLGGLNQAISIEDLGAGYGGESRSRIEKTMSEVVRSSGRRRRNGELLFRICQAYQPESCLELGTNLGLSTLYQMGAVPEANFVTIEGAPELAALAKQNMDKMGFQKVELRVGDFAWQLDALRKEGRKFDHVLIDGNHRYQSTVTYFDELLPMLNPGALVIVDDINWSGEMGKAWDEIRQREEVSVDIDLFFMGLCFVNRQQEKESFKFRFFSF